MQVWIRKTRKKSICFYCSKEIENGTYQIVCKYYMPVRGGKTWAKLMLFHTTPHNCWLDRAIAELESKPVLETRGGVSLNLSDPVKEARNKILRRRASVVHRLNKEMYEGMRPAKLTHLVEMLDALKGEIESYGGVPESWN